MKCKSIDKSNLFLSTTREEANNTSKILERMVKSRRKKGRWIRRSVMRISMTSQPSISSMIKTGSLAPHSHKKLSTMKKVENPKQFVSAVKRKLNCLRAPMQAVHKISTQSLVNAFCKVGKNICVIGERYTSWPCSSLKTWSSLITTRWLLTKHRDTKTISICTNRWSYKTNSRSSLSRISK